MAGKRLDTETGRRVAMVTGASSGLGAAIAIALGSLGWPVALGARRSAKLDAVMLRIEAAVGKAFAHPLDVTDDASVHQFVSAAEAELGAADVVVSNAGISQPGKLPEMPHDD